MIAVFDGVLETLRLTVKNAIACKFLLYSWNFGDVRNKGLLLYPCGLLRFTQQPALVVFSLLLRILQLKLARKQKNHQLYQECEKYKLKFYCFKLQLNVKENTAFYIQFPIIAKG
jgi:hypothetical protein